MPSEQKNKLTKIKYGNEKKVSPRCLLKIEHLKYNRMSSPHSSTKISADITKNWKVLL